MTIDDRLREAAREARTAVAGLAPPAARTVRRTARWRGPLTAVAAAVVVAAAVAGSALLLGDRASVPTTAAPAAPEGTTAVTVPAGAVEVPIVAAQTEQAADALAFVEVNGVRDAELLGQVGSAVLLTYAGPDRSVCLVAVAPDTSRPMITSCSEEPRRLEPGPSMSAVRDDARLVFQGEAMGRVSSTVALVVVTTGDDVFAQRPVDGFVYVPFDLAPGETALTETFAADGRRLSSLRSSDTEDTILSLLDAQIVQRAAELLNRGYGDEQVEELEEQLAFLREAAAAAGGGADYDAGLAAADAALEELRRALAARRAPQVLPVDPAVVEAIGPAGAIETSPDGVVWVAGGKVVVDQAEQPSSLFAIDGAGGDVLAAYEVGLPMYHVAAGLEAVWFGRAGDGALPTSVVGFVDRRTGEVSSVEVDLAVLDIVTADETGEVAHVIAQEPGAAVIAQVSLDAPEPRVLDVGIDLAAGDYLVGGVMLEGDLVVADSAGALWRVDLATGAASPFARFEDTWVQLAPGEVPGATPGVWVLAIGRDGGDGAVVLLDDDGDVILQFGTPAGPLIALAGSASSSEAHLLAMDGTVWVVGPARPATVVARVDPGDPDTGFSGIARRGSSLWLTGGSAGLVEVRPGG